MIKAAKEYASTTSEPGASDAESSYSRTGADQGPPFESDSEDEAPKSDKHVCKKQNLERPVKAAASIAKWLGTHKAFSLSDHANLLGVYRLSLRKLSKNDQYQVSICVVHGLQVYHLRLVADPLRTRRRTIHEHRQANTKKDSFQYTTVTFHHCLFRIVHATYSIDPLQILRCMFTT